MLAVGQIKDMRLAGIKHPDGTIRFQVVDPKLQPEWYRLICAFAERSDIEAILNTSFNTFGEPLVESPDDAIRQFLFSRADMLVIGNIGLYIEAIPSDIRNMALQRAWEKIGIDILGLAFNLEKVGYMDIAVQLLCARDYKSETAEKTGTEEAIMYHGLMLRWHSHAGRAEEARYHAEVILKLIALPSEVALAAKWLMTSPDSVERDFGLLIAMMTGPGSIANFLKSVVQN